MPGMPGVQPRSGMPQSARYNNIDEDPIVPPTPRRGNRRPAVSAPPAASKAPAQPTYTDTSKLPFRDMPDEIDYDECDVDEIHSATRGRPRDSLTGRQIKGSVVSAPNREATFMTFSQPLYSKLGPGKLAEALELAKSVWNAVNDGPDAERVLLLSAGRQTNLGKIIQLMLTRKNKFFANETWSIDEVMVNEFPGGRMDIHLKVVE